MKNPMKMEIMEIAQSIDSYFLYLSYRSFDVVNNIFRSFVLR